MIMLAAVAMTGQGEALGMAVYDGRWYIVPSNVRIQGGGWTQERVPVDGFEIEHDDATGPCSATTGSSSPCSVARCPDLAPPSGSPRPGTVSRAPSSSPR